MAPSLRTLLKGPIPFLIVGIAALLAFNFGLVGPPAPPADGEYNWTEVTVSDENGEQLGVVQARVADTQDKRYTGLSNTTSLDEDEGMIFTYEEEGEHTYVMRDMDFPLDIIFIGADGKITEIYHAPVEPGTSNNDLTRYTGTGQYVLEVNEGWTTRNNVSVGDTVSIGD
ncbi:DUF192 domain-containing protein [Haladaptatus sp. GCM10025707]|uniref:DUF192 domain-containing protein n=1 Tax=unclassified Haladaptatus TaxID=2622732 RepID=UPI0023E8B5AE|nr:MULTISPECIES: DUF192 domain-containing protein [unclassified Haladaptatus]